MNKSIFKSIFPSFNLHTLKTVLKIVNMKNHKYLHLNLVWKSLKLFVSWDNWQFCLEGGPSSFRPEIEKYEWNKPNLSNPISKRIIYLYWSIVLYFHLKFCYVRSELFLLFSQISFLVLRFYKSVYTQKRLNLQCKSL